MLELSNVCLGIPTAMVSLQQAQIVLEEAGGERSFRVMAGRLHHG
jgi:hypothetical protein